MCTQKSERRPPAILTHEIGKYSIPEAANGGTGRLIGAGPAHIAIVFVKEAVPGGGAVELGSTPEESEVSNIVETTIGIARTTWESGEATCIDCSYIWRSPKRRS
jgi:hypothetical protein